MNPTFLWLATLCTICVSIVGAQDGNITCLTGSTPFPLALSCTRGFYCPFDTPPTYCSPTPECSIKRMTMLECDIPQGTTEPVICPAGKYCPTPQEMYDCPAGYYCHTGTAEPVKCDPVSLCPKGTKRQTWLGSLVICLVLDVVLIAAWLVLKRGVLKRKPKDRANTFHVSGANANEVALDLIHDTPSVNPALVSGFESAHKRKLSLLFEFDNLSITLPNGKKILQGVTGSIQPGRVTAIMGPSGAGKTTFMNCLMGKVKRTGGVLHINHSELEMQELKQLIGYVPQDDIMISELTVRENIQHSARIRLPSSWSHSEVAGFTQSVLDALDLAHVADTEVGDHLRRGVSGGQKKRTNIGMELGAAPLAIFLDEPTSGLDSTAALKVAQILKQVSTLGLTIVAVVHQPRQEIFDSFDDLLLIAPGGITAYLGPRDGAVGYFQRQGFVFDPHQNTADVLMDILSGRGKKVDESGVNKHYTVSDVLEHWQRERVNYAKADKVVFNKAEGDEMLKAMKQGCKDRGANVFYQAVLCHSRSIVQQYRLVPALVLEIAVSLLAGLLMGIAIGSEREIYRGIYRQPFSLLGPAPFEFGVPLYGLLFGMSIGLAGAPAGVKVFGEELHVFFREAAAGHSKIGYYIGKTISMLWRLTLTALHFTTIYHLLALPLTNFASMFTIVWLFFFCVYGLAAVVSMLVRRENASLLGVVVCLFAAVFNGFGPQLAQAEDWGLLWFWDISYARWLTNAMYTREVTPFELVYEIELSAKSWGYVMNTFARDCSIAFTVGVVMRIVGGALLMWVAYRKGK